MEHEKCSLKKDDVLVLCLCGKHQDDETFTKKLIDQLEDHGFPRSNLDSNIFFTPGNSFQTSLEQSLNRASKVLLIFSTHFQQDERFSFTVENVVCFMTEQSGRSSGIIPIVVSENVRLPLSVKSLLKFEAWKDNFSKLVTNLMITQHFCDEETGELEHNVLNMLRITQNPRNLNKVVFPPFILEEARKLGINILQHWGVESEGLRISFCMNKLKLISDFQRICLLDFFGALFNQNIFLIIRIYSAKKFHLRDIAIHEQLHSDLIHVLEKISFKINKNSRYRYHYRRHGLTHTDTSETAFNLLKQTILHYDDPIFIPEFEKQESRISTFDNYPIKNSEFRFKLAHAGFFYLDVSDYVQCFHCGACLRTWHSSHDPLMKHTVYFPECKFVKQQKIKEYSEEDIKGVCGNDKFTSIEGRLDSFKTIKISSEDVIDINFRRFAEAGFYYCGIAEDIVCHVCNVGFTSIRGVTDPFQIHKECSPVCPYLKDYIEETSTDERAKYNIINYLEIEFHPYDLPATLKQQYTKHNTK